jgi:AraC-like DNA-binding protein
MTPWHFTRIFKKCPGVSPYQYLLHCRITRAKEELRRPRAMELSELAPYSVDRASEPSTGALRRRPVRRTQPEVLLSPLTTQEAVLSSKIEGTQATLGDVLKFEAGEEPQRSAVSTVYSAA